MEAVCDGVTLYGAQDGDRSGLLFRQVRAQRWSKKMNKKTKKVG